MEKSKHIYRLFDIPYEELSNFINPIELSIDIPFADMKQLSNNKEGMTKLIRDLYANIFSTMPNVSKLNNQYLANITYTSHISGYDFRFNPINFINRIFRMQGFPYQIPYINLDDKQGREYFKDYLRSYFNDAKRVEKNNEKLAIIEELQNNVDSLLTYYDINLSEHLEEYLVPKNVLFYLAYTNLVLYEETGNKIYTIYPYEYFNHVSHMKTSAYPCSLNIPGKYGKRWFTDFRDEYKKELGEDYEIDDTPYLLHESEIYVGWDILKPGMIDREIRDLVERSRTNSNVDYDKYQRLFEMKMNYYTRSGYNRNIIGKYGLQGYVGFTYPNEYLVFDKFHNSETINPDRKTILTHGEAIYALPSDRFSIVSYDKQKVQEEKKLDERIKKINHNETFIKRLDPIVHGPNVSTSTFEEESEKLKQKILIKKH